MPPAALELMMLPWFTQYFTVLEARLPTMPPPLYFVKSTWLEVDSHLLMSPWLWPTTAPVPMPSLRNVHRSTRRLLTLPWADTQPNTPIPPRLPHS